MTTEQKNSQAYQDCANYAEPSIPNDEVYMERYRYWRAIARYPEDIDGLYH
jgi:hypothetical protein